MLHEPVHTLVFPFVITPILRFKMVPRRPVQTIRVTPPMEDLIRPDIPALDRLVITDFEVSRTMRETKNRRTQIGILLVTVGFPILLKILAFLVRFFGYVELLQNDGFIRFLGTVWICFMVLSVKVGFDYLEEREEFADWVNAIDHWIDSHPIYACLGLFLVFYAISYVKM